MNIVKLNLKIFKYFGLLLDDFVTRTHWEKAVAICRQVFTVYLIGHYFMGTLVEIYLSMDDLVKVGSCFIYVISHLKNAVKMGSLLIYRKKFLQLISDIENKYYIQGITPTDAERAVIQNYMDLSNRIAKYLWVSFFVAQLSIIVNMPSKPDLEYITDPEEVKNIRRGSAVNMWFPFQAIESPYFELMLIYEYITMAIYFILVTIMNITIVGIIIHVTALFALLADSLKNATTRVAGLLTKRRRGTDGDHVSPEISRFPLDRQTGGKLKRLESSDTKGSSELPGELHDFAEGLDGTDGLLFQEEMRLYLRCCVAHHQELLEIVKLMDSVLNVIMITQILTSAILFAFLGILVASASDSAVFLMALTSMIYVVLETGLVCWIATELTIQSEMVGEAAYKCGWFNEPVSFQNSIGVLIMRAQRPVKLSVGPFGTLSLELFGRILNSAYSYFTLLNEVSRK